MKKVKESLIVLVGVLLLAFLALGLFAKYSSQHTAAVYSPKTIAQPTDINLPKLLILTNEDRAAAGLPPLKLNNNLQRSAQDKCNDLKTRNYWSHTSPDGQPFYNFIVAEGTPYIHVGENLATGQTSALQVESEWMNSPEHKENIMDRDFTDVGFAKCYVHNFVGADNQDAYITVEHLAQL